MLLDPSRRVDDEGGGLQLRPLVSWRHSPRGVKREAVPRITERRHVRLRGSSLPTSAALGAVVRLRPSL
jgi:hypothetical protein